MGLVAELVALSIESLVVGVGIYLGAGLVVGEESYFKAFLTALVGAVVFQVVGLLLGWIPLLGALAALVAYVAVVKGAYESTWLEAGGVAAIAWVTLQVVSLLLAVVLAPLRLLGI